MFTVRRYVECLSLGKNGYVDNGALYTASDLARIVGISASAMSSRLKTMSVKEAANRPKGPTGPKPKND